MLTDYSTSFKITRITTIIQLEWAGWQVLCVAVWTIVGGEIIIMVMIMNKEMIMVMVMGLMLTYIKTVTANIGIIKNIVKIIPII